MTIFTPRGLKVCLPVEYAFALMSRLHPRVHPIEVLTTAEGIDTVPAFLATSASIVAFLANLSPEYVAVSGIAASIAGLVLTHFRLVLFVPGLVSLATLFSYLPGLGITTAMAAGFGYWMRGWQVAVAVIAARIVGIVICNLLEVLLIRVPIDDVGVPMTESEINFLTAYIGHAMWAGAELDLSVVEDELEESNWAPVFLLYQQSITRRRVGNSPDWHSAGS
ncbi:MAG: hypothetical protein ACYTGL_19815 [Planctomycetota bacterium]